jgi:hypothetical protein
MALSRREAWSLTFLLCALLIAFTLIYLAAPARAQESGYTADDTLAAIWQYSIEFDISYTWLRSIVRCETGGDYNPYARGRLGERGAVQLHPRGELLRFYAWGYDDPDDPYQAVRFLAQRINQGGVGAWSCR